MADAADLKSAGEFSPCRFESGPRQVSSLRMVPGNSIRCLRYTGMYMMSKVLDRTTRLS